MSKRLSEMDDLSNRFAKEAAERQVAACTDIEELRAVTLNLVSAFFAQKTLLMQALYEKLPQMPQKPSPLP